MRRFGILPVAHSGYDDVIPVPPANLVRPPRHDTLVTIGAFN